LLDFYYVTENDDILQLLGKSQLDIIFSFSVIMLPNALAL